MKRIFLSLSLSVLVLAVATVQGQPLSYSLLPIAEGSLSPSPRFDGTIAYDSVEKQIFLFGGQDAQATRNDLWSYSLTDRKWTQVEDPGTIRPQARFGHTLILDSARRRLILFGGQAGGFFSDVWAFDIARSNWQQLSRDDAGPSRRYGHSAIYETARDRMVISHGFTNAGRFDDTWAFDLTSNVWKNISPPNGRPLRRCLHHAVYNAGAGEMLLYGGCSSGSGPCPQADLWSFDLATNLWTERTPRPSPPGREHYGTVFDASRSRLILFGGSGNSGLLDDTWEYDPQSRTWQTSRLEGPSPSARSRQEGTAAADLGATFFFGGNTSSGLTNELWMLATVKPPVLPTVSSLVNTFSGEGGAVAPGEIVTMTGANFGPEQVQFGEFDSETNILPFTLAGLTVTVNGFRAPIYFVRSEEIRIQIPYEIASASEAKIIVTTNSGPGEPITLPVVPTRPALLRGEAITVIAGSIVDFFATGQGVTVPPSPTGARPTDNVVPEPEAAVTLTIGGREVEILSRGQAGDAAGVLRIVARIPEDLPSDPAAVIVLSVGGASSQSGFTIAVRKPE